jgi:DNA-binding FadR family transcriptional regulator
MILSGELAAGWQIPLQSEMPQALKISRASLRELS